MFQGNNVWDEEENWAVFQELGSCPATIEAARCADAYGLMPRHDVQQSAEQAYTKAEIEGGCDFLATNGQRRGRE